MALFWFWLLVFLAVFAIAAAPGWPYTRERRPYRYGGRYRYYPVAGAGLFIAVILLLFWLGYIAIVLPWAATPPPPAVN